MGGGSHPARGAWIEMETPDTLFILSLGRTPQGVRGLKYAIFRAYAPWCWSHPARGAWIEIPDTKALYDALDVAPRKGCVD